MCTNGNISTVVDGGFLACNYDYREEKQEEERQEQGR